MTMLQEDYNKLTDDEIRIIKETQQNLNSASSSASPLTANTAHQYYMENDISHVHHRPKVHRVCRALVLWES